MADDRRADEAGAAGDQDFHGVPPIVTPGPGFTHPAPSMSSRHSLPGPIGISVWQSLATIASPPAARAALLSEKTSKAARAIGPGNKSRDDSLGCGKGVLPARCRDRKSTRLNSSH